jgi:hypothetical protein
VATASRRSASGAECGSSNSSARPGTANHTDSPVSHIDTDAPAASAVAATVKACAQRSGASAPDVHLTTSEDDAVIAPSCCNFPDVETAYLVLLVCVFLAIAGGSAYLVAKLLR